MPGPTVQQDLNSLIAGSLSDAYRLAVVTLEDPVEAGTIVHDAIMSVWPAPDARPETDLDDAFRHRLEAGLHAALGARPAAGDGGSGPLETAIAALSPRLQVELARAFGPWVAATRGVGARALKALEASPASAEVPASQDAELEQQLRDLYAARDPGDTPPLGLRLRLQQDSSRADGAAAARARRDHASGWGFVINAFLAFVVLTLIVSLSSVVNLRASAEVKGDPTSDPASPLTITAISVVQGGIDGGNVHVGATQKTLIASFSPSPLWHVSERGCLADIVGTMDWQGRTTWVGARAGHIDAIAGDPLSTKAYVADLGDYCQAERSTTDDGGLTWASGSLPGPDTSIPTWIAFDPTAAGRLVAYSSGVLYESSNGGLGWNARNSAVIPFGFDSYGRLVGWAPDKLYESLDDGTSWQKTGPGPAGLPSGIGATPDGSFVGASGGLWWYPLTAAPVLLQPGSVFSIASFGTGAVVLGADSTGHPWLGTVDSSLPGISLAPLPPDIQAPITGGSVALNDCGAMVAFAGDNSVIAFAGFAH